jgi:hypothetical protein
MNRPEDGLSSSDVEHTAHTPESEFTIFSDAVLGFAETEIQNQFLLAFDQINASTLSQIGGKAMNLVELTKAGLPVPSGYCISTDVHEYYIHNGKFPNGLIDELLRIKENLGSKIAIRSSANCEDDTDLSMAGVFRSDYVYTDEEVPDILQHIYQQARSEEVDKFMALHGLSAQDVKMGLVIQELIEPEASGVIYTKVNGDKILVQYIDDFGARLVDGETQGSALLLDQNGTITKSAGFETRPLSAEIISQIINHSQTIGNVFPGLPQDIEFACKNGIVYILQARTLTADLGKVDLKEIPEDTLEATKRKLRRLVDDEKQHLGTHTAIFSDANYSELLPRPTEMDIGIHMYVWGGSDGIPGAKQLGHAAMGYLVSDQAKEIIKYIGGRTYFSIGRNAGVYHIGFPATTEEYYSSLVNEYLTTVEDDPERGAYPQMGLYLQDPTLEDLHSRFGDKAPEYFQVYQEFVSRMRGFADEYLFEFETERLPETIRFIEQIHTVDRQSMTNEELASHAIDILEHNRTQSYVDFVKGARLGFYYSQRLQNLLRQKLGIDKAEAQKLYSRLNQGLDGSAVTEANLAIAVANSDEEAMVIAQRLVGHYSTGEMLEIRHQPMRDDPEKLQAYVKGIRQTGQYKANFEKQRQTRISAQKTILSQISEEDKAELEQVMHASQTYMAVRETAKYHLTKEYLYVRDALELLGEKTGLEDGDVYYLYPRELRQFASDPPSLLHVILSRKQSFQNYAELDMPSVIRESDIESLHLSQQDDASFTEAQGKFLAEGPQCTGVIVNVDEFESVQEVNGVMNAYQEKGIPIILAATQMNLSHDPLLGQATGLVIKNAGLVAHGAQRARELGKGAIGGINTKLLKTGMEVLFDPETRTIKKVDHV